MICFCFKMMRRIRTIFIVYFCAASLILVPGCALFQKRPDVQLPDNLPTSWAVDVAIEDLPIAASLLDLVDDDHLRKLVKEALENNPNLNATALRLKAAGYFLSGPRSRLLPKVNAGFAKGRNNQGVDAQTGDRKTENSHRLSLGVSWEIDIWGRFADEYAASQNAVLAQEYEYLHARDALAARAIQAWIEQVAIHRSMRIEEERVAILQRIEQFLIERYAGGIGNWNELAAAKSRTEIARADLSQRRAAWHRSIRGLEVLLGRYPRAELLAGEDLPAVNWPPVAVPATALLNRPDIRAALARAEAAKDSALAAQKALLPELRLSGQLLKSSTRLGSIGGTTTYWEILGGVFQPLFEGGRIIDESRGRRSEAEAALMELHHVVLQALKEVENALDQDRELAEQVQALEVGAKESKRSSLYFNERYLEGLDSIQSPLIAKEQEMAVRIRLNQVSAARLSNRIDLSLALGIGLGNDI